MAHFYGLIKGNRGEATRLGTQNSGFDAFANGWDIGARVHLRHDKERDCDVITIYKTGGSNGQRQHEELVYEGISKEQ